MLETAFQLLSKPVRRQLEKEEIAEPSEIQRLAIPVILEGKNVLIIAPTGTGKTYAAILPVFDLFLSARSMEKPVGISILYITPLRALNRDLLRRLSEIGKDLDIDVQVRHGDTVASVRAKQAKFPPDMLITTPETLQAILPGKRMREHLKHVKWAIIDEIHELASDKRGTQLAVALERLRRLTGREFQRIGLSATIGEEDKVARFLAGTNRDAKTIESAELKTFDVTVEYVAATKDDYKEADRLGIPAPAIARVRRIIYLISRQRSTLVFTNTREHAEALGSQIHALNSELPVNVHHGSLSREIREEVERGFQEGKVKSVICTSSLELGIDIGSVDFIIQYMSPREATRLIQRVGRSGHRIKGVPKGCIIAGWADDIIESSVIVNLAKRDELEQVKIHENALDVLAHQIIGMLLDFKQMKLQEVYQIVRNSYPYRDLPPEDFMAVVRQLENLQLLRLREDSIQPRYPKAFRYYYSNLSVIPDVKKYTVFDFIRKRKIGVLDQEFVAKRCSSGAEFIMHGQTWRIVSVDETELSIEVEPTAPSLNAIPSWEGEIIPVSYEVAVQVGNLRGKIANRLNGLEQERIAEETRISESAIGKVIETVKTHIQDYPLPTDNRIIIENYENCIVVHCCFGNLVNETIGTVLATILSSRYGVHIATQVDPYRVALMCPFKINAQLVANELMKLTPEELEKAINEAIERTELFAWRHWHVARRFGAVERTADYKMNRARLLVDVYRGTPINKEAKREIFLEKLDVENAKRVVQQIIGGKLAVELSPQKGTSCSPFAMPIVDKIVPHDLLRPAVPTASLAEIVKERLLSHTVRLVCIFNVDWEGIRSVKTLSDRIRCPVCNSTLIAVTYQGDEELFKISKKKKKQQLTIEEQEAWNRGWKSASLVQTAGKKAVISMSGRGVGPTTAARILRKFVRNEQEFYAEILKAEREYARTRLFWD